MAFKGDISAGYKARQAEAAKRLAGTNQVTKQKMATTHGPLPAYSAPGVNKSQTIQKDINKSHGVPAQNRVMLNKKALQPDLHGSTAGYKGQ